MIVEQIQQALDGGPPVVVGPSPSEVPPQAAVVLPTSGSTSGAGRQVWLSADALRASAEATFETLAGPGQWALVLPTDHIAGIQVVVRSVLAGFEPRRGADIADAVQGLSYDHARYISIVPTQLVRALSSEDPATRDALASLDAVLVGGAALSDQIRHQAQDHGINVVTTYGMTETAGGCIYNQQPLPGVRVKIVDSRIHLAGPMLAGGYLGAAGNTPEFYQEHGIRWFITSDLGQLGPAGLQVMGRADEAINSGGLKIHPAQVEQKLRAHLPEVMVLGIPDPEWGEIVTVVVEDPTVTLEQIRHWCGAGPIAPRGLIRLEAFPRIGIGKLDRNKIRTIAKAAHIQGQVERWPSSAGSKTS